MPSIVATRRASSTADREQQPPCRAASSASPRGHCWSVTPTTSWPSRTSSAATTLESTPPDRATAILMGGQSMTSERPDRLDGVDAVHVHKHDPAPGPDHRNHHVGRCPGPVARVDVPELDLVAEGCSDAVQPPRLVNRAVRRPEQVALDRHPPLNLRGDGSRRQLAEVGVRIRVIAYAVSC